MLLPEDLKFVKLFNGRSHIFLGALGMRKPYSYRGEDKPERMQVITWCGQRGYLKEKLSLPLEEFVKLDLTCHHCERVFLYLKSVWGLGAVET